MIRKASLFVTWHTIVIESLIAMAFLIPKKFKFYRLRNYILIVFMWTTYLSVPVYTFGWMLAGMCYSQTTENEKLDRLLLLITLPLMFIYKHVPIFSWLNPFSVA
jgi:hypothetical protein